MSTAPQHEPLTVSGPGPQTESATAPAVGKYGKGEASFDFGYREVQKERPDGTIDFERIPLTLEDVLHPQFGDVHVLGAAHGDDCRYLQNVLMDRFRDDQSVTVLNDVGIFWDIPDFSHHSPDISVIFGVQGREEVATFEVGREKVRPVLIIEVTSPSTRVNDVATKVDHYARAGVPHYVIVDTGAEWDPRKITLKRYRLGASGRYEDQPATARGLV